MGKKLKQKLEHNASQSPCLLLMVCLYQCLALPFKEKGKSFHRKVLSDIPAMRRHAQVAQSHLGGNRDFHHLRPKMTDPRPC